MLITTMHEKGWIDESSDHKKTGVILFYNSTEMNVDVVDKK